MNILSPVFFSNVMYNGVIMFSVYTSYLSLFEAWTFGNEVSYVTLIDL